MNRLSHAHQENDREVMAACGFSLKMTVSECVAAGRPAVGSYRTRGALVAAKSRPSFHAKDEAVDFGAKST